MITRISGTIKPEGGQGLARQNYTVMIPEIAKDFPVVKDCGKHGTINVRRLNPPLRKSFADHWTPRITWHPIAGRNEIGEARREIFGFIKIKFEYPLGGQAYDAWVILPEGHRASYSENAGVEIISETLIPDVRRGAACAIYIDHKPSVPRPHNFGEIAYVPVHMRRLVENPAAVPC
jgi:hypothetical protein